MATQCIDISADKNLSDQSPIAMFAFVICYIVTNILMDPSFMFVIVIFIEFALCQILFQYSSRIVYLGAKFLLTHSDLSPTFKDKAYFPSERDIVGIRMILPEDELYE